MTDLVEILRAYIPGEPAHEEFTAERIAQAAGEIERLRKQLEATEQKWSERYKDQAKECLDWKHQAEALHKQLIKVESDRKELSDALLSLRPLGGSECFVRRGQDETETYIADAKYFVPAIKSDIEKYLKTITAKIKAENALREIQELGERAGADGSAAIRMGNIAHAALISLNARQGGKLLLERRPKINYEAWARTMIGFIRSKGLEQELTDWCGGWACPVKPSSEQEASDD